MAARARRRDRGRAAAAAAPADRVPAAPPPRATRGPELLWGLAGALALLPLLWAARSPVLGVPVADDYLFLAESRHGAPDFFGPMGAAYYWRPVSRQLYYLLLGPRLVDAPWLGPLVAALLLLALYALLYRVARRRFDPAAAAAIAAFPLLAEPSRVLLAWPSAAQHLLGAVFAALAVERALAAAPGAIAPLLAAAAAALFALLGNEAAALVLPALPLVAWFRHRSWRETRRWGAAALAIAAVWAAGYAVARAHGSALPAGDGGGLSWRGLLAVFLQSLVAQFGHEAVPRALATPLLAAAAALLAAGAALSLRAAARARIARAAPGLLGALAWFVAGVLPLALLLPDWNAWRTTVASLGLALALGGWLALAWRPLVLALVALRLAALLAAYPAPAVVSDATPPTASSFSFARITRLQRIVESTRRMLRAEVPRLPPGAVVRFGGLPRLAEVGFNGTNALWVWYGDTTLTLTPFGGHAGVHARTDVLLEYEPDRPWPAMRIEPEAFRLFREAYDAGLAGRLDRADSLLVAARGAQRRPAFRFHALVDSSRQLIARRGAGAGLAPRGMRNSTD